MKTDRDGRTSTAASVVALGMFDGVHIGHQVLLQRARKTADREGLPLVVQTFAENPLCVLDPARCPPMLTLPRERARQMERLGVDILCEQPFTQAVRELPPEDFVGGLVRRWHPVTVVVGYNYTFGKAGAGTPALLAALGGALGLETVVVPAVCLGGAPVSATEIRRLLAQGDARAARLMLGRPYARDVERASHGGGRLRLRFSEDRKQNLPAGRYRALLEDGKRTYPVSAYVRENETVLCPLPDTVKTCEQGTLRFIARRP